MFATMAIAELGKLGSHDEAGTLEFGFLEALNNHVGHLCWTARVRQQKPVGSPTGRSASDQLHGRSCWAHPALRSRWAQEHGQKAEEALSAHRGPMLPHAFRVTVQQRTQEYSKTLQRRGHD